MKKYIIFCICCLVTISIRSQTIVEQIKEQLEQCLKDETFRSCDYNKFFYKRSFSEMELDSIFLIHKNYYENTNNSHYKILSVMKYVYDETKNKNIKKEILYLAEQAINDTRINYSSRQGIAGLYINNKLDLSLFDRRMKDEIIKNLNYTYKKGYIKNNSNNYWMLNERVILLAGALEIKEVKGKLYAMADSTDSEYKKSAQVALCRMGDKRILKEYINHMQSMKTAELEDAIHKNWKNIEYIKQPEIVDFLLKILYSDERGRYTIKETIPPDKLAYYAMRAIERISKNCPINANNILGNEKEATLIKMREWAKNNKIIINRDIW
ncbi:MAG: hypothetical protein LBG80_14205 [Bacteroidales bacterium]|nr:hypothetical protein [Bacteroidales bacterium]